MNQVKSVHYVGNGKFGHQEIKNFFGDSIPLVPNY